MAARWRELIRGLAVAASLAAPVSSQVLSPKVLRQGQPDATDLKAFAQTICARAGARTPRERAEAIWRFFLTDGRFVAPGFWYHIAGWAYEEPLGEVLDPLKLLNSYGFGLCYQLAPLLEAVWEAAGFEDARVWFLTGHTVAEVYYGGAHHHFDADMMGYTLAGGSVASVSQLAGDSRILLDNLRGPGYGRGALTPEPWYPADVRAGAMAGLAGLFTTRDDNYLFPFTRAPHGHSMDFALRPGEKLIRYFEPEEPGLYYLPYQQKGADWQEFPREIQAYGIRTADGPRSQKDGRRWGTGRWEYRPAVSEARRQVFDVSSPYVIIDAAFEFQAEAPAGGSVEVAVSVDEGRSWQPAGALQGPHRGRWTTAPEPLGRTGHGVRTAAGGRYGYQCAIRLSEGVKLSAVLLTTRVQVNPRTLAGVTAGRNEMTYTARRERRHVVPLEAREAARWASGLRGARWISDGAQGYWLPAGGETAEITFRLKAPGGRPMTGFSAGGRFLDLSEGLAPDKFTAEVRKAGAAAAAEARAASIEWSLKEGGPWAPLWKFDADPRGRDGRPPGRHLAWPEADRGVALAGVPEVFVRYRFRGMAVDDFRLSAQTAGDGPPCALNVTHLWKEDGVERRHMEQMAPSQQERRYAFETPAGATIENVALVMECRH